MLIASQIGAVLDNAVIARVPDVEIVPIRIIWCDFGGGLIWRAC